MTYTVKYRRKGRFFWTSIKRVKADLIANDVVGNPRVFILDDETRIEVPTGDGLEIKFSGERFLVIKQNMEKTAGQTIPVST